VEYAVERIKIRVKIVAEESQCNKCTGLCCRYFALPIETPETKEDYDDIRWYLCHKNITVFVESGDWYISIKNMCRHLSMKDYRCKIYDKRPKICRQYRHSNCDYVEGKYDYELHFTNDRQMQEYIEAKFGNNVKEKQEVKNSSQRRPSRSRKRERNEDTAGKRYKGFLSAGYGS
jgi:Fe-S-cluster containining protein